MQILIWGNGAILLPEPGELVLWAIGAYIVYRIYKDNK